MRPEEELTEIFRLWREDDLGNQFPMDIVGPEEILKEKLTEFENKAHKQIYFIKPEIIPDSHEAS